MAAVWKAASFNSLWSRPPPEKAAVLSTEPELNSHTLQPSKAHHVDPPTSLPSGPSRNSKIRISRSITAQTRPSSVQSLASTTTKLFALKQTIDTKIFDADFPLLTKLRDDLQVLNRPSERTEAVGDETRELMVYLRRMGNVHMIKAVCISISLRATKTLEGVLGSGRLYTTTAADDLAPSKHMTANVTRITMTAGLAMLADLSSICTKYQRCLEDHRQAVEKLGLLVREKMERCTEQTRDEMQDYWFLLQSTVCNIANAHAELKVLLERFGKEIERFGHEIVDQGLIPSD